MATSSSRVSEFRQSKWFKLVWIIPSLIVLMAIASIGARWFIDTPTGSSFLAAYPGDPELPNGTPEGFPWWRQASHFFNFFMIVLIIRTGWVLHTETKPEAYWRRNNTGRLKTKGAPEKISINLWLHLSLDALWLLNGFVFVVLLFSTGYWARLVPTTLDVFPHAISSALQYLSFDWPLNASWTHYNGLQQLAYFVTIFVAGPLAAITGLRLSPIWPKSAKINKWYSVDIARKIHFTNMTYFVVYIIGHVVLVFTTGMRLNLNHMFANQPEGSESWWGFGIFVAALIAVVAGWIFIRPSYASPAAELTGKVTQR